MAKGDFSEGTFRRPLRLTAMAAGAFATDAPAVTSVTDGHESR